MHSRISNSGGDAVKRENRSIVPRIMPVEFRVVSEAAREAEARVCVYNVIDDYGTLWLPGCWTESLRAKLPKVAWGHDWLDIIGRAVDFTDSDSDLRLLLKFSEFDSVPRARQAWVQLRDGDVDEWSFGFDRLEWVSVGPDAPEYETGLRERMVKATMYEASPVLVGAVPGTATVGVRSATLETIVRSVAEGETSPEEAVSEIERIIVSDVPEVEDAEGVDDETPETPETPETEPETPETPETETPEIDQETIAEIEAEADEAEILAAGAFVP